MKSRLKQQIFALSLLAWTAVCPADAQQTRSLRDQFLNPSDEAKIHGPFGIGCMVPCLKKGLQPIWRQ